MQTLYGLATLLVFAAIISLSYDLFIKPQVNPTTPKPPQTPPDDLIDDRIRL